jgi:Type IV secretion-system coupling protein DNA-binding domain
MEKILIKTYDNARALFSDESDLRGKGFFIGHATDPYDSRITRPVYLDQAQHLWVLGATGMGKTKLLESMLEQDIAEGHGFANIDFHGDATRDLLRHLAARLGDLRHDFMRGRLVFIKPSDPEYAVGFNPLMRSGGSAYGTALELLEIVRRLWAVDALGPRSQEIIRNLFAALVEADETLDMTEVFLGDASFRERVLDRVKNMAVRHYWQFRYGTLSEKMRAMYREPTVNKFSAFLSDPNILAMVSQKESTVNFRRIIDAGGWLVIDLNKGELKANAYLLGAFFVAKLKEAAFSRVDLAESTRRQVSVYLDEFQNVSTDNFVEILTEARKYKLFFRLCHQHLGQTNRDLKAAVVGSASIISFRLSHQDAAALAPELDVKEARRWEQKLTQLQVGEAVLKRKGETPLVVKIRPVVTPAVSEHDVLAVVEFSRTRYGKPKSEVLRQIEERRQALFLAGFPPSQLSEKGSDHGNEGSEGQSDW